MINLVPRLSSLPNADMNPFLEESIAAEYESWYVHRNRNLDSYERNLLAILLRQLDGVKTVLDIGSGTGHFTRWFNDMRYRATGIEISPAMLHQARARSQGIDYVEGDAHSLPFGNKSFDVAAMITTLEFVAEPSVALAEAVRVSRRGLLLGVMNRISHCGWRRRRRAQQPVWRQARMLSPFELVRLVRAAAADRLDTLCWRTTTWPIPRHPHLPLPWGGFIGLLAQLQ